MSVAEFKRHLAASTGKSVFTIHKYESSDDAISKIMDLDQRGVKYEITIKVLQ